jgi:hypothetical protein
MTAISQYKIVNGTSYHTETPDAVITILENARNNRTRIQLHYGETSGDSNLGKDWLEENDIHGFIGRSTGTDKVPLLLPSKRSPGGGAILDHRIVKIRINNKTVYQHPKYHTGKIELKHTESPITVKVGKKDIALTVEAFRDGKLQASFKDMEEARRWVHKLGLESAPITN